MPAKIRRIAFILATAIALSSAPSAQALQAPDIRTVDLVPGEGSSAARGFTRLNGWDYFVTGGSNRFNATGIWRTNGATTELVADNLNVALESNLYEMKPPRAFAALGTYLYFSADDGASGSEIWRTDGSSVARVADLCATPTCDGAVGVPFTSGSWVYFNGFTSATGAELWRTNGTTTSIVKDTVAGAEGANFADFYTHQGILYFRYTNDANGAELGQTNGTSSGTVLYNLTPGSDDSNPHGFTTFADRLFFSAESQLWSLTPTQAPALFYRPNSSGNSFVNTLTVVGSQMFFNAENNADGRELWVTTGDPTDPSATTQVANISTGAGSSNPMWLTAFGSRVYFAASDGSGGVELWSSNGRDASLVADINPGSESSSPNDLTVFAGALYLYANDGELWRVTDSTSANRQSMVRLWDDPLEPYDTAINVALEAVGDKLYFHTGVVGAGREYAWMQAPAAPRSVVAPTITGSAKVGRVLTSARGSWSGVPSAITSAQWYRCTSAGPSAGTTTPTTSSLSGCVTISGATKATYKAVAADKGKYLRLRVKAQNESGTVYRWSKATVKIAP
jgi:ELWxxDGT repeat protein